MVMEFLSVSLAHFIHKSRGNHAMYCREKEEQDYQDEEGRIYILSDN